MPAPDFICIGAQKAGTSWLARMLRQHPGVFLPPMKEVHFFDVIYIPEHRGWIRRSFQKYVDRQEKGKWIGSRLLKRDRFADYFARLAALPRRQDAWYAAVFDHPDAEGKLRGEITPSYSILPPEGIAHVRAVNPAMKLVYIVRDPVDRALSHLRMAAARRSRTAVDMHWLDDELPELLEAALARSAYRENIARWEAAFPADQLLYLPFVRMRPEPEALMREVEAFLGLPPHAYDGLAESVHQTAPVSVDPAITALLETRLKDERIWLGERFGPRFGAARTA